MRVLFLTNIPAPYRVDFFNELGKECDLTVLYERRTASDRDNRWISDTNKNFKSIFLKSVNIRQDAGLSFEVIKFLNKNKFDIFVIGGYSTPTAMLAIQILKLKRISFLLNVDGGFIKNDRKIAKLIKSYFIGSASWWLSTGESTNRYLVHYGADEANIFKYPFTSIKKSEILEKNISKENKLKLREELNITGENVAISVGQLIQRKGYDLLIDAWSCMDNNWKLIIIGSGDDREKLEELIKNKNIKNIELVDFKVKNELRKYYESADLFILPTREDIWGLVINEAMAHGLPIITTDRCIAGKELVTNNKNGFVISLEEINKIDFYLELILANIDDFQSKSLEVSKKYTIERMAKKHIDIFRNIISE